MGNPPGGDWSDASEGGHDLPLGDGDGEGPSLALIVLAYAVVIVGGASLGALATFGFLRATGRI